MRPRLILHIGAGKTGTSAIQSALAASVPYFEELGIVVPDSSMGFQKPITGTQVRFFDDVAGDYAKAAAAIARLLDVPTSAGRVKAAVVSAENLINYGPAAAPYLARLTEIFDVSVIAYVRRQDDFLASAWQQWFCKVHSDLWAWTVSALGVEGDWWAKLAPWSEAFGREAMGVRLYPPPDGKALVRDFFESCGLPTDTLDSGVATPTAVVNPSFRAAVQDLVEGNTGLFASADDNAFFDAIYELLGDHAKRRAGEHLYSAAQRKAIVAHYEASNDRVRQAYFPGRAAPLFMPPAAGVDEKDWRRPVTAEQLRDEVDVLAQLFVALYRRLPPRG